MIQCGIVALASFEKEETGTNELIYIMQFNIILCIILYNECENVSHVLWECSAYSSTRASFMKKLQELLEDDYEDFESLDNVEKSSYVLGSELWENKFDGLLALVKEYIVDVWEIRKHKLYDSDSGSGLQLRPQSSPGERSGKFNRNGKFGQNGKFSQNGKFGQNGMSGPLPWVRGQWQWCYGSNMSIIIMYNFMMLRHTFKPITQS